MILRKKTNPIFEIDFDGGIDASLLFPYPRFLLSECFSAESLRSFPANSEHASWPTWANDFLCSTWKIKGDLAEGGLYPLSYDLA